VVLAWPFFSSRRLGCFQMTGGGGLAMTKVGPCFRAYVYNYIGAQGKVIQERRLQYLKRPTHPGVHAVLDVWEEQFHNWWEDTGLCPVDLSQIKHGLGYMVRNRVKRLSGGPEEPTDYEFRFEAVHDSTIPFDKKIKNITEKGEIMESELKPQQLQLLLARNGAHTCPGRFYRIRIQNYFGQRRAICRRLVLHPLKKESCPGCPECAWLDELDWVHSGVESFIELGNDLQHGQKVFLSPVFGIDGHGDRILTAIQCLPVIEYE